MGQSPESGADIPVRQPENQTSPWNMLDLLGEGSTRQAQNSPGSDQRSGQGPDNQAEPGILPKFSLGGQDSHLRPSPFEGGQRHDWQPPPAENQARARDSAALSSVMDRLPDIMSKIGQFLESVLPPEYAQYVQQYLPMAEQYISSLLRDVKTGDGPDGSKHLEAELNEPHSIPDVLPDTSLEVDSKIGFDMKWGADGAEVTNIQGLKLQGQTSGEVRSGRLEINDGSPTLFATVQGQDGQTSEVPIPLPDISSLISQFDQGF
jgi:hypothetical protein